MCLALDRQACSSQHCVRFAKTKQAHLASFKHMTSAVLAYDVCVFFLSEIVVVGQAFFWHTSNVSRFEWREEDVPLRWVKPNDAVLEHRVLAYRTTITISGAKYSHHYTLNKHNRGLLQFPMTPHSSLRI